MLNLYNGLTRLALAHTVSNMRELCTDFLSKIAKTRLNCQWLLKMQFRAGWLEGFTRHCNSLVIRIGLYRRLQERYQSITCDNAAETAVAGFGDSGVRPARIGFIPKARADAAVSSPPNSAASAALSRTLTENDKPSELMPKEELKYGRYGLANAIV